MKKKQLRKNIGILVNAAAVVLVWRGLWIIFDLYVFPESLLTSAVLSIIIGLLILLSKDHLLNELK